MQVAVFVCKQPGLHGRNICAVCNWIVVKQAGKRRGRDNGSHVSLGLAPIALINIRRQYHQAVTSSLVSGYRQIYCIRSTDGGDPRNEWPALLKTLFAGL